MKYFIIHHQHKGKEIEKALRMAGHRFAYKNVDIALFDHAINRTNPSEGRGMIKRFHSEGATIIMYPHSPTGAWWMDLDLFPKEKLINCNLQIAEGQKKVAEIIEPESTNYIIGWSYCPIRKFQKPKDLKRILFAPIHPPLKGHFREEAAEANARVYKALLKLTDRYQIVVRHIHPLDRQGLWQSPKPIFVSGKPDGSYKDIEYCDVVIAEGTFMYMSAALGKPTIGINQHVPIRANHVAHSGTPNQWDKYGDYMAYPIDFDEGDIMSVIDRAFNEPQDEWRKLFIGKVMQPKQVSDLLVDIRSRDGRTLRS